MTLIPIGCWDSEQQPQNSSAADAGQEQSESDATIDNTIDNDEQASGTLRGSVKLFGKQEHSGILVQVDGSSLSTTTNNDGDFSLEGVPAATVSLSFSFPSYQPEHVEGVVITENQTLTLDPVVLRLGRKMRAGEGVVPFGYGRDDAYALYFSDFSPFLGSGSLWVQDLESSLEFDMGDGVSPATVFPSPDGKYLTVVHDVALGTGTGTLVGLRFGDDEVVEISQEAWGGAVGYVQNGAKLIYLANVDLMRGAGDLDLVDGSTWQDTVLGQNVVIDSVELTENESALWFASNPSSTDYTADLYHYAFGSQKAEKVDSKVALGVRYSVGDADSIVYLKNPGTECRGTLAHWAPNSPSKTLGSKVPCPEVHVSGDSKNVLFLSDYDDNSDEGVLQHWSPASANPTAVAQHVHASMELAPNGSVLVYRQPSPSPDPNVSAWDFQTSKNHSLGIVSFYLFSENSQRLVFLADTDETTELGELQTIEFATEKLASIATEASRWGLEIDPSGRWIAYQRNTKDFKGDLWLFDTSDDHNEMLLEKALPSIRWSEASPLMAYFTEPADDYSTAVGYVKSLKNGKTVSLGRIGYHVESPRFGLSGEWVVFSRNLDGNYSGDLWVWDAANDPWQGQVLGTEIAKNAFFPYMVMTAQGLLFGTDATQESMTLRYWSLSKRETVVLGANLFGEPVLSDDGNKLLFLTNFDNWLADLFYVKLADPTPIPLGKKVHYYSMWVDADWNYLACTTDGKGDLGTPTVIDLQTQEKTTLGKDTPFFGIFPCPDGHGFSYLHDWDLAHGNLSTTTFAEPSTAVPIDENATETVLPSNRRLMYVVQGDAERAGIYVAPLPSSP